MDRDKHREPVRKRKVKKQPGILLISLVMLFIVLVGGSLAFLQDATNMVENTFIPAHVSIEPTESVDQNTKSNIKFQNTGNVPVYIRAALVIYWTDMIDEERQIIAQPNNANVAVGTVKREWTQEGNIYYYNTSVEPGEWTTVMLEPIIVTIPDDSNVQCHIDVRAEAIQADGLGEDVDTAQKAWAAARIVQGIG